MSMSIGCVAVVDTEWDEYQHGKIAYFERHPEARAYSNRKYHKSYDAAHPEQTRLRLAKHVAKRERALGHSPMNRPFPGSEGHHIDKDNVIYIPKALHCSIAHNIFTGKNMDKINAKACAWLTEDWT